MQRGVLAGAAVLVAVVVVVAFLWLRGEDPSSAEGTAAPETTATTEGQGEAIEGAGDQTVEIQEVVRATEEGVEAVSGAADGGGQVAALPPDGEVPGKAPRFDIVRVEPSGEAVIAGQAEPGSTVILLDDEQEIARITADETGDWVMILAGPLAPGDHQLGLRALMPDGSVQLSETLVIVSVPETAVAVAGVEAGDESQLAGAQPLAVETQRDGLSASRVLQQPADAGLRDQALLLNAVDYDAEGFVIVSGRAQPGARVVVYLDEAPLGTVVADANGYWQLAPDSPVASGLHRLRVDQVDDSGDVLARVATLFSRAELAGGFPEDRFVIVQPGNSLWRIARRTYGEGVRYSVIFQANTDQIIDPDLIFPGQIFLVPSTN